MTIIVIRAASPTVAVVSLIGEHDVCDRESLKAAFSKASVRAPNVVVDLTRCSFIDSTVVSALLHAQSVVRSDAGRFAIALAAEPNAVTRTAGIMNLSSAFDVYSSLEAALASMPPPIALVTHVGDAMPHAIRDLSTLHALGSALAAHDAAH